MVGGDASGGGAAGERGRRGTDARCGRGRRYEVPMDLARGLTGRSAGALIAIRPVCAGRDDSPA
eukprot:10075119-Alexandrium_andersonii.AAC.1